MSVGDNFEIFCSNLRMDNETVSKIHLRYRQIAKKITLKYRKSTAENNYSFYAGSYGRGTEISANDIDMVVELPYSIYTRFDNYSGNGQAALLQEVKEALEETLSTSVITSDENVIKICSSNWVSFRVLPGFINNDRRSVTRPDASHGGRWRIIDPRSEIAAVNSMDIKTNKNLKRLCRMARAWKDTCNVPMNGILMDTLAYKFIQQWEHRKKSYDYYALMSRDFFKYLKDIDESQSFWLAPGSDRCVDKNGNFQNKASLAYDISLEAINNNEDNNAAKQKWREIYGTRFPE